MTVRASRNYRSVWEFSRLGKCLKCLDWEFSRFSSLENADSAWIAELYSGLGISSIREPFLSWENANSARIGEFSRLHSAEKMPAEGHVTTGEPP